MMKKILLFCCVLFLLLPAAALAKARVGEALPTFSAVDLQGNTINLDEIVGEKPVLLIFWASWCGDCPEKLNQINSWYRKYGQEDMAFIGINVGMNDTEKDARAFVKKHKMLYPNIFDSTGELSEKFQLNKVFAIIAASKSGVVMMRFNNVPEFGDESIEILNEFAPNGPIKK